MKLSKRFNVNVPPDLICDFPVYESFRNALNLLINELDISASSHNDSMVGPTSINSNEECRYPLSFLQVGIYLQEVMNSVPYELVGAWKILGPLSIRRLLDSLHKLIQRHSALRVSAVMENVTNEINSADGLDLSQLISSVQEGFARLAVRKVSSADVAFSTLLSWVHSSVCDLEKSEISDRISFKTAPLRFFELILLQVNESEEFYFGIYFNHILCDGWSFSLVLKELEKFYCNDEFPVSEKGLFQIGPFSQTYNRLNDITNLKSKLDYFRSLLTTEEYVNSFHPQGDLQCNLYQYEGMYI
jgi:hypothetical protein